jgi:16S rRNA (uracil1498-N3)-methyltransferase
MPHRFFLDAPSIADHVELDEQEARHLRDVMRLKVSDDVELFNGQGVVAIATISKVAKRSVELHVQSRRTVERSPNRVMIASAVPKGERFRWMIEKLTELNVDRFIPLQTHRSVVAPGESKLQRMRQNVISAAKQCGRNYLMTIDPLTEWEPVVAAFGQTMILADPKGQPLLTHCAGPVASVFAIGPEGGFTDDESRLALNAGATPVCFGETILRVETAAIAAAVVGATMVMPNY